MRDQQLQEQLDRTLRFPITDTSPLPELPSFSSRASKLLGFDSQGDPTLFTPASADADTVTPLGATTARALAERFADFYSVKDFGAVGDGEADDTLAIRAAFAASSQIYFPPGVYKITDEIDLRAYSGLMISGAGNAANPEYPNGFGGCRASSIRQSTSNKRIFRFAGLGHQVEGLYLDYATQQIATDSNSTAIELNNIGGSLFRNLTIYRAHISIGISQIDYGGTGHNTIYNSIFESIHSYKASGTHLDLRNYEGGGTNTSLRNIYINGGGSLDFATAGQICNYAMRFSIWSGLEMGAVSIDGQIVNEIGVEFNNCSYVAHSIRFEASTLKQNLAQWVDHAGGYCNGVIGLLDLVNCRWLPSVANAMYLLQNQATIIKLLVAKVRLSNGCSFDVLGTRRAFSNNGPGVSGAGYINDVRVHDIEDQEGKLTDLVWSDTLGLTGPYNVREWRGGYPQLLLRSGQTTTSARIVGGTAPPTGGAWALGDIVINLAPGDIGRPSFWQCSTAGSPGIWIPISFNGALGGGATTWGDVATTLTPQLSRQINIWITTLTADRTVTLSTSNIWPGCTFEIVRTAGGAFSLNVGAGPLKTLAVGEWCKVTWDGFNWRLTGFGSGV